MSNEENSIPQDENESSYNYEVERYENLIFEFTAILLQTLDADQLFRMQGYTKAGLTENIPSFSEVIQQAVELAGVYVSEENWRHLQRLAQKN